MAATRVTQLNHVACTFLHLIFFQLKLPKPIKMRRVMTQACLGKPEV